VQISAAISPGSSGSPAVNMKGQAFGVNTFFRTEGQLLNFAVSGQSVLNLNRGSGITLEERAEGWLAEAKEQVKIGRAYMKQKEMGKALAAFDEAQKLGPDLAEAHYEMGLAFLMGGSVEGAQGAYKKLQKLDPRLAAALARKIQVPGKSGTKK
jgi:tetratricopeptide (TPR) repeat protein